MSLVSPSDASSFDGFSQRVLSSRFAETAAAETGTSVADVRARLAIALAESAQTLRLLVGIDVAPGRRILEVGAGFGLTSGYLSSRGFDVTALEPGGVGFESNQVLFKTLADLEGWRHDLLPIGAERLDVEVHGRFDLIFSNNVLEHVSDPAEALTAMWAVLEPGGVSVHSCPNYSVPFEPHFGIPLVPARPRWTEHVLPRSVRTTAVWRSLNFIRASDVVQIGAGLGANVQFRPAALATSLARLETDADFRARHRLLGGVAVVLSRLGLVSALRRLPSTWSTPMDFAMTQRGASDARIEAWMCRGEAPDRSDSVTTRARPTDR